MAKIKKELSEGNFEVAYIISNDLFRGFGGTLDDRKISNATTVRWMESGLPAVLFPNFVDSWQRQLSPRRISTVAHPCEIGKSAAQIITSNLVGLALNAWMLANAEAEPTAVVDKVALLRAGNERGTIKAEAELGIKLHEASLRFHEATVDEQGFSAWAIPHPLGKYVLGVASSAD